MRPPYLIILLLALLAFGLQAWGQYTLDWWTVDGGGGRSTAEVFSVTHTIGWADAGAMSGGNFTLHAGLWSVIAAMQTPGAPYLRVFRTTTNTVAVW